jgi:hypothetical protein
MAYTHPKIRQEIRELMYEIKSLQKKYHELNKNPIYVDGKRDREQLLELWKTYQLKELKSVEFRSKHIAASLCRGTPYEKIEQKVREGNEPDWREVGKILEEYTSLSEMGDEAPVCADKS